MKNLLTAFLPALALFALGGCAGTSALTSSEDDGVYYSSKDRTTAVVSTAPAPASTNEATNPDYNGNSGSSSARQGSGSDQYYDNTYSYMRGVPGYGLSYYTPYSPYTSLSYGGGCYGWGGGACGFSPYAYGIYDPFYSPYYSPYGYGYGSGVSISFGFGRPWGYGGYGYGYGRPYGYGYGGGFYDPYYYGGPLYGGYYGRGGYYGSNYYGGNYGGYSNRYYGNSDNRRYGTSGHRNDRSSDGRYSSGGTTTNPGGGTSAPTGGRVRTTERVMAPNTGNQPTPSTSLYNGDERRRDAATTAPTTVVTGRGEDSPNKPRRMTQDDQPQYRNMDQPAARQPQPQPDNIPGQISREDSRGRWRNTDAAPQGDQTNRPATVPQPQEGQRRRGGFLQDVFTQPNNTGNNGQAADQPDRQRSYDQPRQQRAEQPQQRTYEQPQRTAEQPQQRTYEQPQRAAEQPQQRSYSQPSYSAPSNSGGGNSGGSNGGGGGGRGRSRGD